MILVLFVAIALPRSSQCLNAHCVVIWSIFHSVYIRGVFRISTYEEGESRPDIWNSLPCRHYRFVYIYLDVVPPIHAVSYHVATDKVPPKMATSSGLFLETIYNQSQLAERKHVARYWSINTVATVVPLSAHPSPLVITTKLAAVILGGPLFGRGVLPAQYCPGGRHKQVINFLKNGPFWPILAYRTQHYSRTIFIW